MINNEKSANIRHLIATELEHERFYIRFLEMR